MIFAVSFIVSRSFMLHSEVSATMGNMASICSAYAGEYFSDYILFWIPFYYFLKLGVLLWFIKGQGAKTVYMQFFGLLLKKYEHHIDKVRHTIRCDTVISFSVHCLPC